MMGVRVRVAFCVAAAAAFTFDTTHRLQTAGRRVQLSQAQPLLMANNPGALKRIRTNERNRLRNREWRSKVRTWTKKTKDAIAAGDVDAAKECARVATSMIDRATRRNIYHKNWAARNKSRLSKQVIALISKSRGEGQVAEETPDSERQEEVAV